MGALIFYLRIDQKMTQMSCSWEATKTETRFDDTSNPSSTRCLQAKPAIFVGQSSVEKQCCRVHQPPAKAFHRLAHRLPELVHRPYKSVRIQMTELSLSLHSHGKYTLAEPFWVPPATWQTKTQEEKEALFGEFLAFMPSQKTAEPVTTSKSLVDGVSLPPGQRNEVIRRVSYDILKMSQLPTQHLPIMSLVGSPPLPPPA